MNQTALKKRYGISNSKQLVEYIQCNLEVLNQDGEHAVIENGHWVLDDVGVARMDDLLHFADGEPVPDNSKQALKTENEELKSKIEELKACLLKAEDTLKTTNEAHKKEKRDFERQLDELTRQIFDNSEGQKNLNENLIRKYQTEAAKSKKTLEYERQSSKEKIENLSKMVKELQDREKSYNERIGKNNDLRNTIVRLQTELTISGEEQQKLLRDLHEKEAYIYKLEDVINKAKETNNDSAIENSLLTQDIHATAKALLAIVSNLQNSLDEHSTSEDKPKTLAAEINAVSERQRKLAGETLPEEEAADTAEVAEDVQNEAVAMAEETTEQEYDSESPNEAIPVEAQAAETLSDAMETKNDTKGVNRLKEENPPRDTSLDFLRESQEKMMEEIRAEKEAEKKGFFSKVASFFFA